MKMLKKAVVSRASVATLAMLTLIAAQVVVLNHELAPDSHAPDSVCEFCVAGAGLSAADVGKTQDPYPDTRLRPRTRDHAPCGFGEPPPVPIRASPADCFLNFVAPPRSRSARSAGDSLFEFWSRQCAFQNDFYGW